MIQETMQHQPFFTNDVAGLLKVLVTIVVPTAATIVGSVWKFMRGDLQAADTRLQDAVQRGDADLHRDIDGLGARVRAVESRQTALDSSIHTAGREAAQQIGHVRERLATIEKVVMLVERGLVAQARPER